MTEEMLVDLLLQTINKYVTPPGSVRYIWLTDTRVPIARTVQAGDRLNIDFDVDGLPIGIEVLR